MTARDKRQPDLVIKRNLPGGRVEERLRYGPLLFVQRRAIADCTRCGSIDEVKRIARRLELRGYVAYAYNRALTLLLGKLDPEKAERIARRRLIAKLKRYVRECEQRGELWNGSDLVHNAAEANLIVKIIRELILFSSAGRKNPKDNIFTPGDGFPPAEALPPALWCALDLVFDVARLSGELAEAELQAREIMAGLAWTEGTRSGGRASGQRRRADYRTKLGELEPIARQILDANPGLSRNSLAQLIAARYRTRFGTERTIRRMLADLGI